MLELADEQAAAWWRSLTLGYGHPFGRPELRAGTAGHDGVEADRACVLPRAPTRCAGGFSVAAGTSHHDRRAAHAGTDH
ncbi:hypothetical protein [Amycolatopsis ultiminotia]|uniref:hypothetical protein n=1 Tax=Amycolatopsis ultiminotia TaxID=543629 RepID=UPI0031E98995